MSYEIEKEFSVNKLDELTKYSFKEFEIAENEELLLTLAAALPVNIEKEFVPRYVFDIISKRENQKIGFVTLRGALTKKSLIRGGHIGYLIDENYRGHGYAANALTLLKPFMKDVLNEKVLITCDTDNIASRKTIEKIGGILKKIEKQIDVPDENCTKDCCYYVVVLG